jgi:hypothetical protein
MEFMREFPDDETCLRHIWRERFAADGDHAFCQRCERERVFKRYDTAQKRPCWFCSACGNRIHPLAGTIFEGSSTSLHLWFYAMYLITSTRCGISAKHLERELGVTYKTAWRIFNKIRNHLMVQDGDQLAGEVEADETFVGGKPKAYPKRPKNHHWDRKAVVFAAVERGGRVKAEHVPDSRGPRVQAKAREFILPGSMIFTDEYHAYKKLGKEGYTHRRISHMAKVYVDGDVHTQTIEGFFGLFKSGVRGAHHAISHKWLQGYLNEWAWRYNRRDNGRSMLHDLIEEAVTRAN